MTDLEQQIAAAMARGDYWADIESLVAQLDRADAERHARLATPQARLEAALWYAGLGLRVFPIRPGDKRPHQGTRGLTDATGDREQICAWWKRWPGSNVAIATGHLIDVIDIDGPKGQRSRLDHWDEYAELTVVGVSLTPRPAGMHLFIPATGRRNGTALEPGIDYRGAGGYVVAPPSVRPDGQYKWLQPLNLGGRCE